MGLLGTFYDLSCKVSCSGDGSDCSDDGRPLAHLLLRGPKARRIGTLRRVGKLVTPCCSSWHLRAETKRIDWPGTDQSQRLSPPIPPIPRSRGDIRVGVTWGNQGYLCFALVPEEDVSRSSELFTRGLCRAGRETLLSSSDYGNSIHVGFVFFFGEERLGYDRTYTRSSSLIVVSWNTLP